MKLCFLADAGHPNLLTWVEYLRGHFDLQITVLTFNRPAEPLEGIEFELLPTPLGRSKVRYVAAVPAVRSRLRRLRPDLVIAYRLTSYGLMAVLSGRRPVVAVAQGTDILNPRPSTFERAICRYVVARADLVQTWASHMQARLVELGASPAKIVAFPKGVDVETFHPRARLPRAGGAYRIVSSRQLRAEYRHDLILEALRLLRARGLDVRYDLCGDGEDRAALEARTAELELEPAVTFRGRVGHGALASVLSQADVYVSMQPADGVSSSLLEAMACGTFPVVPDNEPNRLWIREGENGFLTPLGDAAALADRVAGALQDAALRDRAAEINWRLVSDQGSMQRNMARMVDVYRGLAEKGGAGGG